MSRLGRHVAPAIAFSGAFLVTAACGGGEAGVPSEGRPEGRIVDLVAHTPGGLLMLENDALWRSHDDGESWASVPVPESAAQTGFSSVATPVGNPEEIFVAGEFGVVRTTDGGRVWRHVDERLPDSVAMLAAHVDSAHVLFAYAPGDGVFRTEDSGGSWSRMDGGPGSEVRGLVHSNLPGSMNTGWLYAATEEGVARAMDCFCGWRPSGQLSGGAKAVAAVAVDPTQPEHVYAARDDGVFGSVDGGATWRALGRPDVPIRQLVVVGDSGIVFGAAADGRILASRDGGETWARSGGG